MYDMESNLVANVLNSPYTWIILIPFLIAILIAANDFIKGFINGKNEIK